MLKLGIIGGMGPEASSYFYQQIIEHTNASCDQEHLDICLLNQASMPDRTKSILTGDAQGVLAKMSESIKVLEAYGCAEVAIPCNTSHFYFEQIQNMTTMHIIHMPEAAAKTIQELGFKQPAVLGTDGTLQSGIYTKACEKFGLNPIYPDPKNQSLCMSLIYEDIKSGKGIDFKKFQTIEKAVMADGADSLILACTELSLVKRDYRLQANVVDALEQLTKTAILRCGAQYKN